MAVPDQPKVILPDFYTLAIRQENHTGYFTEISFLMRLSEVSVIPR